jgi:hypothetical protein
VTYDLAFVVASRFCAFVLVAALGMLPVLPPEHVHELTDAEGHRVVVAHRHVQLHTIAGSASGRRATVDHSDPVTTDLNGTYTSSARFALQAPFVACVFFAPPSAARRSFVATRFSDRLIHAPPRAPSSLRAPPSLRLL